MDLPKAGWDLFADHVGMKCINALKRGCGSWGAFLTAFVTSENRDLFLMDIRGIGEKSIEAIYYGLEKMDLIDAELRPTKVLLDLVAATDAGGTPLVDLVEAGADGVDGNEPVDLFSIHQMVIALAQEVGGMRRQDLVDIDARFDRMADLVEDRFARFAEGLRSLRQGGPNGAATPYQLDAAEARLKTAMGAKDTVMVGGMTHLMELARKVEVRLAPSLLARSMMWFGVFSLLHVLLNLGMYTDWLNRWANGIVP